MYVWDGIWWEPSAAWWPTSGSFLLLCFCSISTDLTSFLENLADGVNYINIDQLKTLRGFLGKDQKKVAAANSGNGVWNLKHFALDEAG